MRLGFGEESWASRIDGHYDISYHRCVHADENPVQLTKEKIHAALARLAEAFKQAGVTGEICIYGGTAMVLAFDAREATGY